MPTATNHTGERNNPERRNDPEHRDNGDAGQHQEQRNNPEHRTEIPEACQVGPGARVLWTSKLMRRTISNMADDRHNSFVRPKTRATQNCPGNICKNNCRADCFHTHGASECQNHQHVHLKTKPDHGKRPAHRPERARLACQDTSAVLERKPTSPGTPCKGSPAEPARTFCLRTPERWKHSVSQHSGLLYRTPEQRKMP